MLVCQYMKIKTGRYKRSSIDTQNRALNFRAQFSMCPKYGIPENYFECSRKDGTSQFDRDCNKILDGFASKFRTDMNMDRDSYLKNFCQEVGLNYPLLRSIVTLSVIVIDVVSATQSINAISLSNQSTSRSL